MLDSPWKCHLLGGSIAVALLVATLMVNSASIDSSVPLQIGVHQVSEVEALNLCELADTLRRNFLEIERENGRLDVRKQLITRWLRDSVDPLAERERIRQSAQDYQVELTAFKPGKVFTGSRVSVWSAECEVEASYKNLCRWVQALPDAELPIACRAIDIRRIPSRNFNSNVETLCNASIELRIPFVGDGTAAAKIVPAPKIPITEGNRT